MTFTAADLLLAWALDAALGDPRWVPWPHPVVLVGRAAGWLEPRLRSASDSQSTLVLKGVAFWALLVGGTAAAAGALLAAAAALHPWLGRAAAVYLAYACLATRCLDAEARTVAGLLDRGRLADARRHLAGLVGRDTDGLSAPEVARGAVETVAENTSDGAVAPLFFLALGALAGWGPLLGLAYKAVNTLDSTVGYRDERYEWFGKAAARLDDVANWVPARLTAALAALGAELLWRRGRPAWRIACRDGRLHRSPNSGFPEAAFAGALGVELGGTNTYRGVPRPSPRIGDPGPSLEARHVRRSLALLWAASAAAVSAGAAALAVV
ncbi:MAG: adenosylcobinamide-phosphate synthase CbiB [Deferrisomatales bacterium]